MSEIRTRCVHTGVYKDEAFRSVTTPIYPTSTFAFEALGRHRGYDYTRSGNPTRAALEENIASLEGGAGCCATATGMAAVTAVLFLFKAGDHIIAGRDIYGGTYRLFAQVLPSMGLTFSFVDMGDLSEVEAAVRPRTRMIWIETPSNPLLHVVDIRGITGIARDHGLTTVADNTFLSPYFQRPMEHGVDVVVHSTTKYLNGHSDVVGGAVIWRDEETGARLRALVNALGLAQAPFDSWLVLRGIKTLPVRMEAHQANALALARFLEGHPHVRRVYYPGLPGHPGGEVMRRQAAGFGGMVSFDLDTDRVPLESFFGRLKIFILAESLGGVESLIEHPWSMSHASMGEEGLRESGISPETVRISVGIEDAADLIADLTSALDAPSD